MRNIILTFAVILAVCSSCARDKAVRQPVAQSPETGLEHKLGSNVIDVTKIAGKGKILSRRILPVYSVVDGVIAEMSLIEGQEVRKGEVINIPRVRSMDDKIQSAPDGTVKNSCSPGGNSGRLLSTNILNAKALPNASTTEVLQIRVSRRSLRSMKASWLVRLKRKVLCQTDVRSIG